MKNKKGNVAVIVAIVAVVALAVGIISWKLAKKSQAPMQEAVIAQPIVPTQTQPADETAGWQTYRNEKYGFEFQYPRDWGIPSIAEDKVSYISLGCPKVKMGGEGQCPLDVIIYPASNPESFLLESYLPAEDQDSSRSKILYSQINGTKAASFIDLEGYYGDRKKVVFFGNKYYVIFTHYMTDFIQSTDYTIERRLSYQENIIFDKILSTFKFTNTNETADWQTYRNEKYGFELKYPRGLD